MRSPRLRALLRLPEEQPGDAYFNEEFKKLVDSAAEIYSRSLGEQTAATYRRRWLQFTQWCQAHERASLPASANLVMAHLANIISADPSPASTPLSRPRGCGRETAKAPPSALGGAFQTRGAATRSVRRRAPSPRGRR